MKRQNEVLKLIKSTGNVLYWVMLIALTTVTLWIVFQQIAEPEKIPHIFGYKMFIILDDYMTDDLQKGDLVITKNVPKDDYQRLDVMAFRSDVNIVTIHQIQQITEKDGTLLFGMKALPNETKDLKYVAESHIEGKMVKTIPWIGLILLYIQMPQVMGCVLLGILIIGGVALWIAKRLDERDRKKAYEQQVAEVY